MYSFDPSKMVAFDLETTTNDPLKAHVVTSSVIRIDGSDADETYLLADPGIPISEEAEKVHGISNEYAKANGEPHDDVVAKTVELIRHGWDEGFTLIVFNGCFDLTILHQCSPDFTIDGLVVDPYIIDKKKDHYRAGKRNLSAMSEYYEIRLDKAHNSSADSLAAARIAWKQARRWPEITTMDGDELMESQTVWYYEMQSDLAKYFAGKGRDVEVNLSWPLQLSS